VNAVKARLIYAASVATFWLGMISSLGMSDGNGI
jgi:hypothetical protein